MQDLLIDILSEILKYTPQDKWIYLAIHCPNVYECSRVNWQQVVDRFTVCIKRSNSTTWTLFGKIHRIHDLPAVEFSNGTKIWYHNDKRIKCI